MAAVGLSANKMQNVSSTSQSENLGNSKDLECMWAMKAMDHAEVYFNLICSVDPTCLHLSPVDDEIYSKFRSAFPDMKVDVIDEKEMKSESKKLKWREFIEDFNGKVEEYNHGTLVRLDCSKGYSQENSTFCVRTQFLAIEIARNRENLNSQVRFSPEASANSSSQDQTS